MKFLQPYIRKHWKMFCVAIIFLTFEAVCDLLQPTILSKVIDVGVAGNRMDYVLRMGGLMLAITLFGACSATIRSIIASKVSQKFAQELRADLYRQIQRLSFEKIDQFERATLITRLTNDVTQVQNFVNGMMRIFVKAPLVCIGSLIMAVRLNLQLSVVLLIVVPLVALFIVLNMKIGFPFFVKVQQALDKVNLVMREYLSGVRVVKAFNRFDVELDKFSLANQNLQQRSTTAMRVMSIISPQVALVVNLGIIAVLWIGGWRVDQGQMQVGHIMAFINYMTQILFSLMMISMIFNMFVRARASAERINEVFVKQSNITWHDDTPTVASAKGRIDFENVSFAYADAADDPVLKKISFSVLPGQTLGIIGSTGSGKSSLIQLIPRFYEASSGTVKVNGQDVQRWNPKALRDIIAIVPQKTVLFSGTVIENIRYGKESATLEEVEHAARMAEAHPFIAASPEGYDSRIGQGGVNFSGGQKQRLSIARALVRKPEILILDDCTSAVDVATEANIKAALREYAADLTCLLIAQRITSVMDADRIIVLDQGEVVGTGRHEELMANCKVYQEIYQSQMGSVMDEHVTRS